MKRTMSSTMYKKKQPPQKRRRITLPGAITNQLLYKTVRPEYKVTDTVTVTTGVTNSATIIPLTQNLSRGTNSFNEFIGNTINPVSISVKMHLTSCQNSGLLGIGPDTNNMIRVLLFQWLGEDTPTQADIFQLGSTNSILSPLECQNYSKLNVFADRQYNFWLTVFQANGAAETVSGTSHCDQIYVKGKKIMPVSFLQSAATVNDNNIYLCIVSDSTITPHPAASIYTRLTYVD